MPNVTSETHRKLCIWLLFPLAAAMNMNFGYLFLLLLPFPAAAEAFDTAAAGPTPKMFNVTSETHRK